MYNRFMELALKQAKIALQAKLDVPVGAVIVDASGEIVSSAYNLVHKLNSPLMHAELLVLYRATKVLKSRYLKGCSIYITLEPCLMCFDAILKHRISRIYFAAFDEKKGILSKNLLHGKNFFTYIPEIYCGIMSHDSQIVLKEFFSYIRM